MGIQEVSSLLVVTRRVLLIATISFIGSLRIVAQHIRVSVVVAFKAFFVFIGDVVM